MVLSFFWHFEQTILVVLFGFIVPGSVCVGRKRGEVEGFGYDATALYCLDWKEIATTCIRTQHYCIEPDINKWFISRAHEQPTLDKSASWNRVFHPPVSVFQNPRDAPVLAKRSLFDIFQLRQGDLKLCQGDPSRTYALQ